MADDRIENETDRARQRGLLACRRTGKVWNPGECQRCPYCFGEDEAVESAERERFCDFHPGKDPVHFGFPGDDVRTLHG